MCLVIQLCPTLCDPVDCSPPGSSVHGNSPGKNTGMGCHSFLQGIFPTQRSNPGLLQCRQILYCLSHLGSPRILEWVAFPFSRGSSQPRDGIQFSCIVSTTRETATACVLATDFCGLRKTTGNGFMRILYIQKQQKNSHGQSQKLP